MSKNSFSGKSWKSDIQITAQKGEEMPELLFCWVQMERAMIHQFKIILEIIYDPVLQMLDPRQKNPYSLLLGKFFPKVSWIANLKKFLSCFKSQPNDSDWKRTLL